MQPDSDKRIQELEERLLKLERILYGQSNDVRTLSVIRNAVVLTEHTSGKPTIINANGKKYNLQTV